MGVKSKKRIDQVRGTMFRLIRDNKLALLRFYAFSIEKSFIKETDFCKKKLRISFLFSPWRISSRKKYDYAVRVITAQPNTVSRYYSRPDGGVECGRDSSISRGPAQSVLLLSA